MAPLIEYWHEEPPAQRAGTTGRYQSKSSGRMESAPSVIGLSEFTRAVRETLRTQTRTSIVVHNKEVFT
jgi:hypothetical protein